MTARTRFTALAFLAACLLPAWAPSSSALTVTDTNAGLPGVAYGSSAWGDFDNDGDLDVAISGKLAGDVPMCSIFRNDGGAFTDIEAGLEPNSNGDLAWGDYNNDGWLDLAVCGTAVDGHSFMHVYGNDSGVEFSAIGLPLPAVSGGRLAWVDANNDGALDLAFAGGTVSAWITKVYWQQNGWFVDSGAALTGLVNASLAWADYDNDGDFDLALQGYAGAGVVTGKFYKNDGAGVLTASSDILWQAESGDLEWGDLDGDGDFDLLQAGACTGCSDGTFGMIYRNNGGVPVYTANLYSSAYGSVAVGDFDGDGDADALSTGRHWTPGADTALYVHRNNGGFNFGWESVTGAGPALRGDARFVDTDNDGRLELFLMGLNSSGRFARVYAMASANANVPPSAPGAPSATLVNGVLTMNWTAATDDRTLSPGLSYNIRVGWAAGGEQVMAANSDPVTGWRRIAQPGNAQKRTSWSVKLPRSDVAYWAVQAVDASFAGGPFAGGSVTPANHKLTASAGANGSISPAGGTWVARGGSQTYTITPGAGYVIGSVKVDGVHVGTMASYTFTNVTADHTITASFSTFVDVTASAVGLGGGYILNSGVSWPDYDGDGDLDLLLSSDNLGSRLLRNDGGSFVEATPYVIGRSGYARGMAWGDYDNDGDSDLYLVHWRQSNRLLRNDGGGAFTDVATPALADSAARGSNAAWADYDLDGDLDLFLVNEDAPNRLFRNDGAAGFTDVATPVVAGAGGARGAAWGDYDGDGDPDLYVTRFDQPNQLLRNEGGAFTDVATGALADAGQGQGVAWADYDADGDLDLYFSNTNGPGKLLRNGGGGVFTDVTSGPLAATLYGRGVAWGDYDNDRDQDLFLVQNGEPNRLLRNDGGSTFTDITGSPLGDNQSALAGAWGDYDGDGRLDLYITNSFSHNRLLHNVTVNGNHWLQVRLRGTVSNRDGIGARVRVQLGIDWQTVEVSGGSGFYSQPPLVASFGLGAWTAITRLEVWWPSGIRQYVPSPAVDQRITITESADQFAEVTGAALTGPENPQGAAWADYDGDGDPDLFLTSDNSNNNRLLRNDAGTFTDVTAAPFTSSGSSYGAGWGDYDGDGDPDLLVGCYGSTVRLLRNDGGGAFADASALPISSGYGSFAPTWLDYDLDGRLDLFVSRGGGGSSPLYRNLGAPGFEDVGATVLPVDGYCHGPAWGDYDDDGDLDLYIARTTLAARLYRNDRGVFTDVTAGTPLGVTGAESAAWGDYDNDGDLDLFVAVAGANASRLFRNDGGGAFTNVTAGLLGLGTAARSAAWLDFDHDGDLDLFRTNYQSPNKLLRNEGGGTFVDATEERLAGGGGLNLALALADYDGDGDMDVFYLNHTNGGRLLRNDAPGGNHGLQVRLRGTFSHRDAVGSRVTVYAGGVRRIRELAPGEGYESQHEPVLDFGLGSATVIDSVFVHWPYGGNQRVTPTPAVDERILVVEAGSVTGVDGAGAPPATVELAPAAPNPAPGRASIAFALPRAARVSLDVIDLAGRRVAALADGAWPAGRHSVEWNPAGRASAGVYFVRLAVDDGERSETRVRKLVLAN